MTRAVPYCEHGNIVLGCPHKNCRVQEEFLVEMNKRMDAYYRAQADALWAHLTPTKESA